MKIQSSDLVFWVVEHNETLHIRPCLLCLDMRSWCDISHIFRASETHKNITVLARFRHFEHAKVVENGRTEKASCEVLEFVNRVKNSSCVSPHVLPPLHLADMRQELLLSERLLFA